jgi:hypothetical protein
MQFIPGADFLKRMWLTIPWLFEKNRPYPGILQYKACLEPIFIKILNSAFFKNAGFRLMGAGCNDFKRGCIQSQRLADPRSHRAQVRTGRNKNYRSAMPFDFFQNFRSTRKRL